MASVVLGFSLLSEEGSSGFGCFFFLKSLVCGAEIFRFGVGEIGESDEKGIIPDIYENIKKSEKETPNSDTSAFLKLKFVF